MIDKSKELEASVVLINNRLHFNGLVDKNNPISIDYVPPLGDDLGYTSLELLLLSLSSCLGSTVLSLLRKMKKTITGCEIHSKGIRRDQHPTGFKTILMAIKLNSPDATAGDLDKAIKRSEETYCPVWAMVRGNVEIHVTYTIIS